MQLVKYVETNHVVRLRAGYRGVLGAINEPDGRLLINSNSHAS